MTTKIVNEPRGPTTSIEPYKQIILFGDSITQGSSDQHLGFGFAPALQNDYIRRLDVVNRGYSGYNTKQALRCIPWAIPTPVQGDVRLIAIFFGANDATVPGHIQNIPLDEYKSNLKAIVSHPLIKAHPTKFLLLTPPPVNEQQFDQLDRLAERTKEYAEALKSVGIELDLPVLDLWTAFMKKAGWKEGEPLLGKRGVKGSSKLIALLSDGLHFTPAGYRLMYEEVTKAIREQLPGLVPGEFPFVLPEWDRY